MEWHIVFWATNILAVSRLGLGEDSKELMEQMGSIFAWILSASTLLSIIDRGLAPLRKSD